MFNTPCRPCVFELPYDLLEVWQKTTPAKCTFLSVNLFNEVFWNSTAQAPLIGMLQNTFFLVLLDGHQVSVAEQMHLSRCANHGRCGFSGWVAFRLWAFVPFPGTMRLLAVFSAFSALVFSHPLQFSVPLFLLGSCGYFRFGFSHPFNSQFLSSRRLFGLTFAAFRWFMRLLVAFMFMFMYVGI